MLCDGRGNEHSGEPVGRRRAHHASVLITSLHDHNEQRNRIGTDSPASAASASESEAALGPQQCMGTQQQFANSLIGALDNLQSPSHRGASAVFPIGSSESKASVSDIAWVWSLGHVTIGMHLARLTSNCKASAAHNAEAHRTRRGQGPPGH